MPRLCPAGKTLHELTSRPYLVLWSVQTMLQMIVSSFVLLEAVLCLWQLAASPCTPGLLCACVCACMFSGSTKVISTLAQVQQLLCRQVLSVRCIQQSGFLCLLPHYTAHLLRDLRLYECCAGSAQHTVSTCTSLFSMGSWTLQRCSSQPVILLASMISETSASWIWSMSRASDAAF